ncbi:MAG TPA: FtsX-like permease family protein, partial [Anaerolineales bacterium]|nr:FtsX-like permease family protein [Anaerolineales bacterium]
MGVLWHKVWYDLWHNKTRTLLAALSIAAGVFAVGVMFGMSDLLITNLDKSHQAVAPPHLNLVLAGLIDRSTALSLRQVPGVEDVEPYNTITIQYKLRPEDPWRAGVIHMRGDFEHQTYELVQLRQGRWPGRNDVGVERMAAQFLKVGIGDSIIFKIDDRERSLPITGLIRHPFVPPPQFMDLAYFFMDEKGLERLHVPPDHYGGLFVRVTPYSFDHVREVATALKDRLAQDGIRVAGFVYQDPNKHWGRSFFDGITLVLRMLALVCVGMSAVLVYNTLSNLIVQQTNQIGILKAIGGRSPTIVGLYLISALVYGALALVIAVPLSAVVASGMARSFLNLFNIDYPQFEVSGQALVFQGLSALVVPFLAGLVPTMRGAATTVRQAIASYGLGSGRFGRRRLDLMVERLGQRWLSSPYAAALGNMFRRRDRLFLTEFVLISAGTAFLVVMSLMSSISATLDHVLARQNYDSLVQLRQNERFDQVDALARTVEGIDHVELRYNQSASLFVAGQLVKEAGIGSYLEGIPAGSDFFTPLMVAGRWLQPGDGRAVVIPRETAERNNIHVGDPVTLDLGELGKAQWQVVGLYEPVFASAYSVDTLYTPLDSLFRAARRRNLGTMLYVRTTSHDPAAVADATARFKDLLETHGLKVVTTQTHAQTRSTAEFQFGSVTSMLLGLSVIVALVGGIALMGALSISVVERTKEIGVLRAIGARSRMILGIFVMEGLLQGVMSWLVAVPVSFLLSQPVAKALGHALFSASLDFRYNGSAVVIWLGLILIISTLASSLP